MARSWSDLWRWPEAGDGPKLIWGDLIFDQRGGLMVVSLGLKLTAARSERRDDVISLFDSQGSKARSVKHPACHHVPELVEGRHYRIMRHAGQMIPDTNRP
jgi:hypothetical protein